MKPLTLFLLLLLGLSQPAQAKPGSLIVILLPGTGLRDWQKADAPHLHRLMATGALAVMNTRTARMPSDRARESGEGACLTLGAGARAAGGADEAAFADPAALIPGVGVTAGALYQRRLGQPPPPGALVSLQRPALRQANRGRGYDIRLGDLADALAARQVPVRAGGGPFAASVAATGMGFVLPAVSPAGHAGECLIWDAGSDLPAADAVLGRAMQATTALSGRLIILSPFAGDADYVQGRRLTPILEWGADVPAGFLTSASTRRIGLVTDTDFAPSVAAYFDARLPVLPFGQAWTVVAVPQAERQVRALEEQSYGQAAGMRLLPYLAVLLAIWILAGTTLAAAGRMPTLWPLLPLALLLAALFGTTSETALRLVPLCVVALGLAGRLFGVRRALLVAWAFLASTLTLDMMGGGRLMQRSLLGYSAVEGARYYGIGNEAMGVLICACLALAGRLWPASRFGRGTVALLLALVALLLGSPLAGAKAGGLLVSLAAFGALLFPLFGGRWSLRVIAGLTLFVALTMIVVAAADALWPGQTHSHMGEAIQRIYSGGLTEAGDIIVRKLAVEGRLASHSAWAVLLWSGLGCLGASWRRSGLGNREDQALRTAGLVAVAACLLLNDAGVVAAALGLVVLWTGSVGSAKEKPPKAARLSGAGLA